MAAAKLPSVRDPRAPTKVIGKNTVACMQSGIFWGYVGLIEGLVARIKSEFGAPMRVDRHRRPGAALRGRDAGDRARSIPTSRSAGLRLVYERNRDAHEPSDSAAAPNRPDELVFLPLGGVGEIGMNFVALRLWRALADGRLRHHLRRRHHARRRHHHARSRLHRRARASELVGIVATHAHEDHIGAIPYLWPRLRCPVYATPFTAAVLRAEAGRGRARARGADHRGADVGQVLASGRSRSSSITLTHSIPEPNAVVLRTPLGTVLHTGDWKFDPDPLVGRGHRHGGAASAGRRGRAGDGLRFHQRAAAGRVGLRGRGARGADRARRHAAATASRSPASPRTSRGSTSAAAAAAAHDRQVGAGRPLAVAHRARGARDRLSQGRAAVPRPRRKPPICRATRCC